MKTTNPLVLGLLTALVAATPAIAAGEDDTTTAAATCPPVWIDTHNNVHYDPDCIQVPPSGQP